ncbi:MAG: LysR family transcriptional regulator [Myxococcota bacterium]
MDELDWNDIRVFLALFRERTVRAAGIRMGMSHSTVSRRLTALEDALGGPLFTRSRDGLVATAMAEQILERAEATEDQILSMQRDASSLESVLTGEIRVAVSPGFSQYLMMPLFAEFSEAHPGIELAIDSTNAFVDLMRGACDVAIRTQDRPDENLVGRRLPRIVDHIYASPKYIAKHRFEGNQTTANWIARARGKRGRAWIKSTPFPDAAVRHVMPDPLDQVHAAAAGMGMTAVPEFLAKRVGGIERVPGAGPVTTRSVWALTHPDLRTSIRVRTFVKFLAEAAERHKAEMAG